MQEAVIPPNEQERLEELYRFDVLYTQYEEDFDQIVKLASEICKVPISTISLIDRHRQWFKAKLGIVDAENERSTSFCAHAILGDELMVVDDAFTDQRFHDNPSVTGEPNIRFYAGVPLVSQRGFKLGTLCVIDQKPRNLDEQQAFALDVLAKQVVKLFELRLRNKEEKAKAEVIEEQKRQLEELTAIQNKIISIIAHDVRGPVSSLKGVMDLRRSKGLSTEELVNLMEVLEKQVDGTLDILTNLVEWGSILLRRTQIEPTQIDMHNFIQDKVINEMTAFTAPKLNQLQNLVPPGFTIKADENSLRFMLRNLISNANKFTSNGNIAIRMETNHEAVKVIVADTGVGMTENIRKDLFNTSKRNTTVGTNQEKGSGLGLILTKEFATTMNAEITVESELGIGTTIAIHLPLSVLDQRK